MRRAIKFALVAGAGLALAGCAAMPRYERPEVELPETWRSEAIEESVLADRPWGEIFQSPELDALVREALTNNRDLRIAAERIEVARARYGIERSFLYPNVYADGSVARQRQPGFDPNENTTSTVGSAGVAVPSWEIDLWGRVRAATESARRQLLSAEETRNALRVSLIAEVTSLYLALLDLDAQLEVAARTVETRGESLRVVALRFEGGVIGASDLRQAESNLAAAELTVASIKRRRSQTENALSLVLGRNPGPIARGRLGELGDEPLLPAGLPSELLERRPDVRAAEQALIAAEADIQVARKEFFPRISLTGFLGFISPALEDLFKSDRYAWSGSGAISAPIFTAGRLRGNLEAARAQQRIAVEQYKQALQNAFREVEDALVAYERLREERAALKRIVDANRERLRLDEMRYRAGVSIYLEVLLAQQALFDAELQLSQTTRAVYESVVQLYAALGGGWNPETAEGEGAVASGGTAAETAAP